MSIINGASTTSPNRQPLVSIDGGEPVPLPPISELHGVDMPGGNLHRAVSESEAGFMTPAHVERIDALEKYVNSIPPALDPDAFAPREHGHDFPPPFNPQPLIERDQELNDSIVTLNERLSRALDNLPDINPDSFARADHVHPVGEVPKHTHPDILEVVTSESSARKEDVSELNGAIEGILLNVEKLEKRLDALVGEIKEALAGVGKAHGHQDGGRMHAPVTDKLAGFMTPAHLQLLNRLDGYIFPPARAKPATEPAHELAPGDIAATIEGRGPA